MAIDIDSRRNTLKKEDFYKIKKILIQIKNFLIDFKKKIFLKRKSNLLKIVVLRKKEVIDMYVKERFNRFGELRFECRCSGKHPRTRKNIVYVKTFPVPLELKTKNEIDLYRLQVQMQLKEEVQMLSARNGLRKILNAK